ncbi:AAA family ATPase [Mycobacterium simulans]|uniref:AAA family ATPase n=1 Tax=Mycobacterium simulans TaxID=627089 RepID=UPI00163F0EB0|nr:MinD/ParA family protein [Mycobacterium simulans]
MTDDLDFANGRHQLARGNASGDAQTQETQPAEESAPPPSLVPADQPPQPAPPLPGPPAGPLTAAAPPPGQRETVAQRIPQPTLAPGSPWGPPQHQAPQWGPPSGPIPQQAAHSGPQDSGQVAVPRGAPQADPASTRNESASRNSAALETRMQAPVPGSRPDAAPEGDQYRRPAAPIQAAATGIRQELIKVATEERSPRANTGWRGALNHLGLGLAPGAKELAHREVLRRIRASKQKMYSIAVLTLKGGAGKTTVTSALGQVFAAVRGDGVMAVDADPSSGDLPMRTAPHPENLSMVDLIQEEDLTQRDFVMRFLSTTDTDLQVLANGWRADDDRVLEPDDIRDVHEIASHYYSLLLWDGDTNLHSPLVRAVLSKSDAVALLVQASPQGAVAAGNAIDWLRFHGFEGLLARTVLVVNESTSKTRVNMDSLLTVLRRQQLKIHRIPFDKHLDEGLVVDLAKLRKKTLRAFEELAAMLADDFTVPQPPAAVPA